MMQRNSIMEPPFFDGTNYPEWKIKMEHFIKASFGMEAWKILVVNRWSPPTWEDGKGRRTNKPLNNWTEPEYQTCTLNSRLLNAIFCSMGQQEFKVIAFCESAKEAWETLQAVHEMAESARVQARLSLEIRFGNMEMEEDETISSYYGRLVDITYEAGTLGRMLSNDELVDKVLWSLPHRFAPKVAAIINENPKGCLKLGDLICSLKAYEKLLERRTKENKKVEKELVEDRMFGY